MTLELNNVQTTLITQPVSLVVKTAQVATVNADAAAGDELLLAVMGLRPLSAGIVNVDGAPLTHQSAPWFRRMTGFAPSDLHVTPDSAIERAMTGQGYQPSTVGQWLTEALGISSSLLGTVANECALTGLDTQIMHATPAALSDEQRRQLLLAVAVARAESLLLVCHPLCPEGYIQQVAERRQLAVIEIRSDK